jgi:hypothetical protein
LAVNLFHDQGIGLLVAWLVVLLTTTNAEKIADLWQNEVPEKSTPATSIPTLELFNGVQSSKRLGYQPHARRFTRGNGREPFRLESSE